MIRWWTFLVLMYAAQGAAAQGNDLDEVKQGLREIVETSCINQRRLHEEMKQRGTVPRGIESPQGPLYLWCNCMPVQTEGLIAELPESATREEALKRFSQATSECMNGRTPPRRSPYL